MASVWSVVNEMLFFVFFFFLTGKHSKELGQEVSAGFHFAAGRWYDT